MPLIPYEATNFPTKAKKELHGSHSLQVTWNDLVWAAITVGKPGISYVFGHGWHSISDMVVRSHTIYANLLGVGGRIAKSTLYEGKDPTEKGATSYFLGMAVAKLFSEKLLDITWLFHLSMAGPLGVPIRFRGPLEPDLIGLRPTGSWVVVEAKGRTNAFSDGALAKAKQQTMAVTRVAGKRPRLRVAVQTYFDPELTVRLDDPEPDDGDEDLEIEVDLQAALRRYYAFAYEATAGSNDIRTLNGRSYVFRTISETGIAVGIDTTVRALIEKKDITLPRELARRLRGLASPDRTNDVSTFRDGLAIALDSRWSKPLMAQEPDKRGL